MGVQIWGYLRGSCVFRGKHVIDKGTMENCGLNREGGGRYPRANVGGTESKRRTAPERTEFGGRRSCCDHNVKRLRQVPMKTRKDTYPTFWEWKNLSRWTLNVKERGEVNMPRKGVLHTDTRPRPMGGNVLRRTKDKLKVVGSKDTRGK